MNITEIDTGHTIINMTRDFYKNKIQVTAFVNGLSLRSSSLHVGRIRDLLVDSILTACDFPDGSDVEESQTYEAIDGYIQQALIELSK